MDIFQTGNMFHLKKDELCHNKTMESCSSSHSSKVHVAWVVLSLKVGIPSGREHCILSREISKQVLIWTQLVEMVMWQVSYDKQRDNWLRRVYGQWLGSGLMVKVKGQVLGLGVQSLELGFSLVHVMQTRSC